MSTLTSTFDQKLRTLNNSSPLDDGSIPYADEGQEEGEGEGEAETKSEGGSPSSDGGSGARVSPAARAHELKAAWLARDHRHSSSSSDEPDARWPEPATTPRPRAPRLLTPRLAPSTDEADDSEKENCLGPKKAGRAPTDDEKDVDTRSQASSGDHLPDNDKTLERVLYPTPASQPTYSPPATVALDPDSGKLKRSESLNRSPERRSEARVLRSESLNCRTDRDRLQRSDSLTKGERLTKLEKGEWNVVRRREGAPTARSTKLKRKNGMPERGIKRRHTVGGTKDFDKDGWSARHTRTSSPDLTAAVAGAWPPPLARHHPLESHV